MSVYKSLITSDVIISPFKVNKSFKFTGSPKLTNVGIDRFIGRNIPTKIWISGSNPTGYISTQDKYLLYHSIKELYYSNYLLSKEGSPSAITIYNTDGTITGSNSTTNYYNYLYNTLIANRYIPTGSNDIIGIISIPSNIFGEYIKPKTFNISNGIIFLSDDGEGSVLHGNQKVGDIIYEHGMVILTNNNIPGTYNTSDVNFINSFITSSNLTCSFNSTITIYENQIKCTIRENEFNFSQNPTLISGSSNSGIISDFATGSYFNPYVTTVGLYNNNKELIAVAKLSQPLPLSSVTDTSILINLDL